MEIMEFLFLLCWIIALAVIITVIALVINIGISIYKKKYKEMLCQLLTLVVILFSVSQSDYLKSRKVVDSEWMIGKPVWLVKLRYSSRRNTMDTIEYDGVEYRFCVREIYMEDWLDGCVDQIEYYVTEKDGKIADVKEQYRLEWPKSDYDYWDRW
ncbi:MAG: hypothetical protein IJM34_09675 [Lachnospiraceae bacterium]|nr:hypothetical protein [Lachnospiraceae bacterium]